MFVESIIGDRNVRFISMVPVVAFVAADQQDGLAFEVEGKQDAHFGSSG